MVSNKASSPIYHHLEVEYEFLELKPSFEAFAIVCNHPKVSYHSNSQPSRLATWNEAARNADISSAKRMVAGYGFPDEVI